MLIAYAILALCPMHALDHLQLLLGPKQVMFLFYTVSLFLLLAAGDLTFIKLKINAFALYLLFAARILPSVDQPSTRLGPKQVILLSITDNQSDLVPAALFIICTYSSIVCLCTELICPLLAHKIHFTFEFGPEKVILSLQ